MTFGKPRHDNKRIIYKQTSANRCGGYFFYNSLRILIVHVFALDHLHGKDLKNCGQFIMKKKFSTNFGWGINCKHERSVPTLDSYIYYIKISFTDIELKSNYNSFGI